MAVAPLQKLNFNGHKLGSNSVVKAFHRRKRVSKERALTQRSRRPRDRQRNPQSRDKESQPPKPRSLPEGLAANEESV